MHGDGLGGAPGIAVAERRDDQAVLGDRTAHARRVSDRDRLHLRGMDAVAIGVVEIDQHPVGAGRHDDAVELEIGLGVAEQVAGGPGPFHLVGQARQFLDLARRDGRCAEPDDLAFQHDARLEDVLHRIVPMAPRRHGAPVGRNLGDERSAPRLGDDEADSLERQESFAQRSAAELQRHRQFALRGNLLAGRQAAVQDHGLNLLGRGMGDGGSVQHGLLAFLFLGPGF